MDLGNADDKGLGRRYISGYECLQSSGYVSCGNHRIDAGFRACTVRPFANQVNIEEGTPSHHRAFEDGELAHRHAGTVMHAKDRFHRELLE